MSQDFSSIPSQGTEAGLTDTADSTTVPPMRGSDTPSPGRPASSGSVAVGSDSSGMTSNSTGVATSGATDVAKDQAGRVAKDAAASGAQLADTAKEQAGKVAAETKTQVKDLLGQAQDGLREQVGTQQKRVAGGLHSIGDELGSMARTSDGSGVATDLVQQLATRADGIASWLDNRDAGSLLSEVRGYARRHPGTFIAIAAAAGLLAGRLTRSLTSATADEHAARPTRASGAHLETGSTLAGNAAIPSTLPPAAQVSDVGGSSYTMQPHPDDLGADARVSADPYRSNESDPYRRSGDLGADNTNGTDATGTGSSNRNRGESQL